MQRRIGDGVRAALRIFVPAFPFDEIGIVVAAHAPPHELDVLPSTGSRRWGVRCLAIATSLGLVVRRVVLTYRQDIDFAETSSMS